MSIIKAGLLIILVVVIILVTCTDWLPLRISYEPKSEGKPRFEIVDFGELWFQDNYYVEFKIKNNGTGEATVIHGIVKFNNELNETAWHFDPDFVLKPNETSRLMFVPLGNKPQTPSVTIVVECKEKFTQQFTKSLPH